jgi:hypothetical protein
MMVTIYVKWAQDWGAITYTPPSLITNMINLALNQGQLKGESPIWGDKPGQEALQLVLLQIAMVCIPLMFLPKVLYEVCCHKKSSHSPEEEHQNEGFIPLNEQGGDQEQLSIGNLRSDQ